MILAENIDVNFRARLSEESVQQVDSQLEQIKDKGQRTNTQLIEGLRRYTQVGQYMVQAFGGFIDTTYSMGIEALILSVEAQLKLSAAITAGTLGFNVATGQLALQAASIASLLVTISLLENGRNEAAAQTQAIVGATRLLTFAFTQLFPIFFVYFYLKFGGFIT
jgi:hypothetical protein